jgi:hypothetical protein
MTRTVEEALREKIDAFAVACARQAITPEGAVEIGATRRTLEAAIRALASPPPAERGMASGECGSCGQTVPLWLGDHQHPEGWPCFGSGCLPSSAPARDDRGAEPAARSWRLLSDCVRNRISGWRLEADARHLSDAEVRTLAACARGLEIHTEPLLAPDRAASSSGEATALREAAMRVLVRHRDVVDGTPCGCDDCRILRRALAASPSQPEKAANAATKENP